MKYIEYKTEGNCIIRTFTKLFNKDNNLQIK